MYTSVLSFRTSEHFHHTDRRRWAKLLMHLFLYQFADDVQEPEQTRSSSVSPSYLDALAGRSAQREKKLTNELQELS
jgi:hypothetical protein